ncbi:2',3'-cyclic-nucleotide 2'-phosphodiesterase/5'-or 3'-nucleotidase, 5'-nucleotidase family [Thalassobacillus cyri]|uniref:2',3'-cyclic-nucleotide 2'-phosphodiesterase/5'-or 3'-nucleotidase, 5'-nucleotidase family n=1 Tax=Thalassobacillus cyri TaxID=571932 RepID=A0A1H4AKS5_9BACI|nr:5'-nucleotidase C-terminal domain-containing protein [Thalassobacillus cyri]SEA36358.1 2',3'-cyclic-nucleotide 2'-phosphodiesterase/5'-or 3'-nucleotidase, 5'-nucleotidase family [Thalassobacillus cyri]
MQKVLRNRIQALSLIAVLLLGTFVAPVQPVQADEHMDDLIISEYVEGGSYNKALELYNGTGEEIDLSQYTLELYSNQSETATASLNLDGTLQSGEVFVVAHGSAGSEIKAVANLLDSGLANFNGDDPVVLKYQDNVVDSIGSLGSTDAFGKDVTLVRNADVTNGDTNANDEFVVSDEWDSYPKDTINYLGSYEMPEVEPVELQTIEEARQAEEGTQVKVKGITTASFEAGGQTNLYIQDDTAGIIVRAPGLNVQPGDEVEAQGEFSSYYGMQQILASSATVEVVTEGAGVPDAQSMSSIDFSAENGEAIEGEFVSTENVEITEVNEHGEFTATDENGSFLIQPQDEDLLKVGESYEVVQGVVDYSYGNYKLLPRSGDDVIDVVFSVKANPASGSVFEGTQVKLKTYEEGAEIYYNIDGSEPTTDSMLYDEAIEITEDTTIKAVAARESGETSEVATFDYTILKPADEVDIHDIQGAGHTSPYEGNAVSGVEGVVTKLDGSKGFYMQSLNPDDDIATSEGIYVYQRSHAVEVGDLVAVDGTVKEWREDGYSYANDLLTTQITGSGVTVVESDVELPDPVVIGEYRIQPTEVIEDDEMTSFDPAADGLDFYESLEGMQIQLNDASVTGPIKYDELPVLVETSEDQLRTDAGGLLISPDDYNPERMLIDVDGIDLTAKTGDYFVEPITGVVSYDYSNFKIRPTGGFPEIQNGGTEPDSTELKGLKPKLTVASYNVENFHAGTDQEKVQRIAETMVENLNAPDIIGLVEVQDNNGPEDDGTVDATESYQTLIEAIEAAGGPSYEFSDIAPEDKEDGGQPGGNIRVGFLYNPDRVSMTDKPAGDATTSVDVDDSGLTLNPGRIDPTNDAFYDSRKVLAGEFMFNGEKVTVIANHFNSKGGDGALFGAEHPVVLGSEEQRLQQAEVVNGFVQDIKAEDPDANVVVLGDLNDFEFSAPVQTLKGDILTNMIEELPREERYTYIYQGNSQVLDHILVSNNLAHRTKADIVNINSDFSVEDGRASDHDPVVVQIHPKKTVEKGEKPGKGKDKEYELNLMHTNDTHGNLDEIAKTATAIEKYRSENPESLLLSAGDVFSGTLYFNEFLGQADLEFMNYFGYDAMTFGNHEFDLGSNEEGHQALADFVENAEFPFVAANTDFSSDALFDGMFYEDKVTHKAEDGNIYGGIIKWVEGEKVGIFGLTTEETTDISSPEDVAFEDYIVEAEKMVDAFEDKGVNKIVALTHLGLDDNVDYDNDLTLAETVDGIDVIVGGHTHSELIEPRYVGAGEEPTVIVQTGEYNDNLGTLDVTFDKKGKVLSYEGELVAIGDLEEDPEVKEMLAPYAEQVEAVKNESIGATAEVYLNGERESVRTQETNLGNLIADGMLAKAKSVNPETAIAVTNGGGIRTSIDTGEITVGEVLTVMPFGNSLAIMNLTGVEIVEALEHSVSQAPNTSGGFLQVAGMQFEYDSSQPAGERVVNVEIEQEDGSYVPLNEEEYYYVATNGFTAKGGDGYDVFAQAFEEKRVSEPGFIDYEMFIDHVTSLETVAPEVEGRIVDVNQ